MMQLPLDFQWFEERQRWARLAAIKHGPVILRSLNRRDREIVIDYPGAADHIVEAFQGRYRQFSRAVRAYGEPVIEREMFVYLERKDR